MTAGCPLHCYNGPNQRSRRWSASIWLINRDLIRCWKFSNFVPPIRWKIKCSNCSIKLSLTDVSSNQTAIEREGGTRRSYPSAPRPPPSEELRPRPRDWAKSALIKLADSNPASMCLNNVSLSWSHCYQAVSVEIRWLQDFPSGFCMTDNEHQRSYFTNYRSVLLTAVLWSGGFMTKCWWEVTNLIHG